MEPGIQKRIEREAGAVAAIREQLLALGQNEPEYLDISIESETNFRELIEELVSRERDTCSLIEATKARETELKGRRDRFEKRKDTLRQFIATALDAAGLPKQETAAGTVSLKRLPPQAIVTEESEIPVSFFKVPPPPDPKLDTKALSEALRARQTAITAAMAVEDADERTAALAAVEAAHPAIPGATLSNGSQTIQIRS